VVSVIMPAFNAAATIDRPIRSLLAQTFRSWQLQIVDDGSRDDTADRAAAWASRDARIRVLRQANRGAAHARNRGITEARGDWIVFLDADDSIDPRHLASMLKAVRSIPGAGAAACGWARMDPNGNRTHSTIPTPGRFSLEALYVRSPACIHAYLLPRRVLQAEGGFDTRFKTCEDSDLWIRLARRGLQFVVVPEVLAFYWDSPGSLTKDPQQLVTDTMAVRALARQPDPRISAPLPEYADGLRRENPAAETLSAIIYWSPRLAAGQSARKLFELIPPFRPLPQADELAKSMRYGLEITSPGGQSGILADWSSIARRITPVLQALEDWSQQPGIGGAVLRELEISCLRSGAFRGPAALTHTLGLGLPAIGGRREISPPSASIDRLAVKLKLGNWVDVASVPLFGALSRAELFRVLARRVWHRMERNALGDTLVGKSWRALGGARARINGIFASPGLRLRSPPTLGKAVARIIAEERDRLAAWAPPLEPISRMPSMLPRIGGDRAPTEVEARRRRLRVPVLTYHRIADDGPAALSRHRISARAFEEQIIFLRRRGFRTWTPEQAAARARSHGWLPGRPVMITFDDGYTDFYETAWSILARNGFTAHNFIVTDRVGGAADWDACCGQPAPLMNWNQIAELAARGATFGSHLATHRLATGLSSEELLREATSSRLKLERVLGTPVTTVATPFGESNELVELVLELAGYTHQFGKHSGYPAPICSNRRCIPRLFVTSDLDLNAFARLLRVSAELPDQAG
jgi:peptidoglycan/xylan/chitin deacetylase (PgdA/CDA1 family)